HDVREDRPHHEVHPILLEKLLRHLQPHVRLELVVFLDDLGGQSAQLASGVLHAQREAVVHVLADLAERPGERRDEPDLDTILSMNRRRHHDEHHYEPDGLDHWTVSPDDVMLTCGTIPQARRRARAARVDRLSSATGGVLAMLAADQKGPD